MATPHIHDSGPSAAPPPWLAFIAGIILVAVVIAAFMIFTGGGIVPAPANTVSIEVSPPKIADIKLPDAPRLPTG